MIDWPSGARSFVESARIARLATSDLTSTPHVVPMCFVLDRDSLYSIVDEKPKRHPRALKRLRNVAQNPRASVVVDHYEEDWQRLRFVLLGGRASIVTDTAERARAIELLRAKYPQYATMQLEGAEHPLVRVAVERVHQWRATQD